MAGDLARSPPDLLPTPVSEPSMSTNPKYVYLFGATRTEGASSMKTCS